MLDINLLDINFTNEARLSSLVIFDLAVVTVLLLNILPGVGIPFRRLSTLIHELGHAMSTDLTDGKVIGIWVFPSPKNNAYGVTDRKGGNPYVVSPAGYLGLTLFSAGLILLSNIPYCAAFTLVIIGLILLFSTLHFGADVFTKLLGLAFSALFIWVAFKAEIFWSMFLLFLVAIQVGFTALVSLKELGRGVQTAPQGKATDDATQMAAQFKRWPVLRSPMFWVKLWMLLSMLILAFSVWFTWFRHLPT